MSLAPSRKSANRFSRSVWHGTLFVWQRLPSATMPVHWNRLRLAESSHSGLPRMATGLRPATLPPGNRDAPSPTGASCVPIGENGAQDRKLVLPFVFAYFAYFAVQVSASIPSRCSSPALPSLPGERLRTHRARSPNRWERSEVRAFPEFITLTIEGPRRAVRPAVHMPP